MIKHNKKEEATAPWIMVPVPVELFEDLKILATVHGIDLGGYCAWVLKTHAYGNRALFDEMHRIGVTQKEQGE